MEALALLVGESPLNRESVSVENYPSPGLNGAAPLPQRVTIFGSSILFSGGKGSAVTVRTVLTSEIGQIAGLATSTA